MRRRRWLVVLAFVVGSGVAGLVACWFWFPQAIAALAGRLGQQQFACANAERALQRDPDAAWARLVLARHFWQRKNPEAAVGVLGEHFPERIAYDDLSMHGDLLVRQRRWEMADTFWTWMASRYPDADDPVFHVCILDFVLGRDDSALSRAQILLARKIRTNFVHVVIGCILNDRDQHQEAMTHFRTGFGDVAALRQAHPTYDLVHARTNYAESAVRLGYYQESMEQAERILEERPGNISGLLLRAESNRQLGKLEESAVDFRQALSREPGNALAAFHLGLVMTELNRPAEAIEPLNMAVRAWPESVEAHHALAQAFTRTGRRQEATRLLKAADEIVQRKRKSRARTTTESEIRFGREGLR